MNDQNDDKIIEDANTYVKEHYKEIVRDITKKVLATEEFPVSFFMSGSPGAGKTEASKQLLENSGSIPILRSMLMNCAVILVNVGITEAMLISSRKRRLN